MILILFNDFKNCFQNLAVLRISNNLDLYLKHPVVYINAFDREKKCLL